MFKLDGTSKRDTRDGTSVLFSAYIMIIAYYVIFMFYIVSLLFYIVSLRQI